MRIHHESTITRYCDDHARSIAERLGLLVKICLAIHHAHQKGVIHRDIKPSNILVAIHDGEPVPKVIDFGIAKITDVPLTESALLTQDAQMLGTPAYMSPEQAEHSGLGLDTRSDIYSLGVLLYELLTGQPPFDPLALARSGLSVLLRTLREIEPPLPSVVLESVAPETLADLARGRATEGTELVAMVRGDLDWITSKAMAKDRSRRYESAHGFAMDISRHLVHEPVVARPPTRRYVLRKLVRRNRRLFASGAVMAAILLIATGVSTRLYLRERDARQSLLRAKELQTSLREEADRRREQADQLRLLAEARQTITQAVVQLRGGDFAAADALVSGALLIQPTPEGAEVFRRLGEWHEAHGRWREAAERFSYLVEVNALDGSDIPTLDHLRAGPVWILSGNLGGFENFRRSMLGRFARKADVISAERTVKVVLLVPAGAELMRKLDPLIEASLESLNDFDAQVAAGTVDESAIWRMDSVALGEYRRGNFGQAEFWARKCLAASPADESRRACARVLLALALHQQSHFAEARAELEPASSMIHSKFTPDQRIEENAGGWWPDWLIARILLHEADALVLSDPAVGSTR